MRYDSFVYPAVLLLAACAAAPKAAVQPHVADRAPTHANATKIASADAPAQRSVRKVGDFSVHRITGSFTAKPMLLSERVVAVDDNAVAIEYTLEDVDGMSQLLVRRDPHTDAILSVARIIDGKEVITSKAEFEALIAKTTFAPDSNEGYVDRTLGTCLVGPSELDCETKSYRVIVGDKEASLDITRSAKMPDRDVSGEITTADGEVIYRAELLEVGNDRGADPAFAARK
jgi:hypothetical protein